MKAQLVIAICLFVIANATDDVWSQYKLKHGKIYGSKTEESRRYAIYKDNVAKIDEHNKKYDQGLVSWYMGVNQFSDMTEEEFAATLTLQPFNFTDADSFHVMSESAPTSIDWRSKGAVTGVKNQGSCGSCWSFSATGTLEGIYHVKKGKLISFSEQNLVDCATQRSGYNCAGCDGGVVQSALNYVRDHGITTEAKYPYRARQASCQKVTVEVKGAGYTGIAARNENSLKNAVGTAGPVSVAINATPIQNYAGGIFDSSCSDAINHGVLAVGYGTASGKNYWILKNSWGTSWGESGYFRIALGKNLCGIANQACYAKL